MINLELSEQHAASEKMLRDVAKNLLRPISRKYDKQEHDVPVELAIMDRRPPRPTPEQPSTSIMPKPVASEPGSIPRPR